MKNGQKPPNGPMIQSVQVRVAAPGEADRQNATHKWGEDCADEPVALELSGKIGAGMAGETPIFQGQFPLPLNLFKATARKPSRLLSPENNAKLLQEFLVTEVGVVSMSLRLVVKRSSLGEQLEQAAKEVLDE